MQKTIIKTAIITLCAVLIACAITFGGLSVFAPTVMGNFYSEMGKDEKAFGFYEKAYKKEQNEENFVKLINSAIAMEDDEKLIKYFSDYEENNYSLEEDYLAFIVGKYCVAQVKANNVDQAFSTAIRYSDGYNAQNPIRYLIAYGLETKNKLYLTNLLSQLTDFKSTNYNSLSAESKERIDQDVANLTTYCEEN